jgi:hypothetical protein
MTWLLPAADSRARLEAALVDACREAGVEIDGRKTQIHCRLDEGGRLAWFEPMLVRVPSSVLERGFDETGGGAVTG